MEQHLKAFVAGACLGAATVCAWGAAGAQFGAGTRIMVAPLAVTTVAFLIAAAGWWLAAEAEVESTLR